MACSKKESGSLSVTADYLHITGIVTDLNDQTVSGVDIYIPGIDQPVSFSEEDGEFSLNLSDSRLEEIIRYSQSRYREKAPDYFRLVFVKNSAPSLVAASSPLLFNTRGSNDIGKIKLAEPSSVSGRVVKLPADGNFIPAAGVTVRGLHKTVVAGEDGRFLIEGLPYGESTVYAEAEGFSPAKQNVIVEAAQTQELDADLILFPGSIVSGWVSSLPAGEYKELLKSGHPYQRSFSLASSPKTKYVRYHHDRSVFDAGTGDAAWKPVKARTAMAHTCP